jgi:hypothetical protein
MALLPLLLLALPIVFVVLLAHSRGDALKEDALLARLAALAGEMGSPSGDAKHFAGDVRGRPYTVAAIAGTKDAPSALTVELTLNGEREAPAAGGDYRHDARAHLRERPWVVLRREGWIDRLGKALGINREITVDDAAFDRAVYVEAAAPPGEIATILRDPRVRAAVARVIALGFTRVTLHDGADALRARREFPTEAQLSTAVVREVIEQLDLVAVSLPTFESPVIPLAPRPFQQRGVVMLPAFLVPFLAFMFGMIASSTARLARPEGVYLSILAGVVAWLVPAFLLARLMRGRADSFRRFLWVALPLLGTMAAISAGALPLVNAAHDETPATTHELRITRRFTTQSKKSIGYHLWVAGDDGGGDLELPHAEAYYDRVRVGDVMLVETHPGALGWRWIEGARPLDP